MPGKPSGLPGEIREVRRVVPGIYGHTAAGAFGTGKMGAGLSGSTGTCFCKLGLACRVKSFLRMPLRLSRDITMRIREKFNKSFFGKSFAEFGEGKGAGFAKYRRRKPPSSIAGVERGVIALHKDHIHVAR